MPVDTSLAAARRQIPIRIIWLVFVGIFWVFFCIFACVKKRSRQKAQQVQFFMEAWAKYAIDLSKQMGVKSLNKEKADKLKVGANFREADLDNFSDEQLAQLYELFSEAKKPIDTEKDPHLAS